MGLTQSQGKEAAAMALTDMSPADLAKQMEVWRQQNITNKQTAATANVAQQTLDVQRQQQYYENQVKAGWEDIGGNMIRNRFTGETKYAGPPTPRGYNVPGVGFVTTAPGGATNVAIPVNPQGIAAQEEAKTSGAATGTQTVQQYNGIIARAQQATKSEGDIDYASNQLAEAAKGGQKTGFFSPAIATAAAAAKSLGIDTSALGIDPSTVGNIQSAQKTLAVLGASILQTALGGQSQITDAKIQAYEHTQPGIENDPQALQRIMAWARSQFTYERELGNAAATEAGKDENNGTLPPTFLPRYYATKGFAPVYDSVSGEMQQPDGRQPARQTPPPVSAPPPPNTSRVIQYDSTGKRVRP